MTIDQMMIDIIKLYPENEWKIEYSFKKDAGNELVPYCFVSFGKYDEEIDEFFPLYIDSNGKEVKLTIRQKIDGKPIEGVYECAIFYYETDVCSCVREIYKNIKYRNKK